MGDEFNKVYYCIHLSQSIARSLLHHRIQGGILHLRQGWRWNHHHKGTGHSDDVTGSEPNPWGATGHGQWGGCWWYVLKSLLNDILHAHSMFFLYYLSIKGLSFFIGLKPPQTLQLSRVIPSILETKVNMTQAVIEMAYNKINGLSKVIKIDSS